MRPADLVFPCPGRIPLRLAALGVLAWALGMSAHAHAAASPSTSFRQLVTTNGFSPAVYDLDARRIVSFREHLYRTPAPGQSTRELAYDLYLGLRAGGQSGWLTDAELVEGGYEPGTGLIRTVQDARGLRVTTTYTSPFGLDAHALLVIAEVENTGGDASDVALFSIHNFHVGGSPSRTAGEHITWDTSLRAFLESSGAADAAAGVLVAKPLSPITHHAASPQNPYPAVIQSRHLQDVDDSGIIDDAVSGFEVVVNGGGRFPHGAKTSFAFVVAWAPDRDAAGLSARIDAFARGRSPGELLEGERTAWRAWHGAGLWPVTKNQDEEDLARQSLAMIRMAQVREPGPPFGGILASLPPGHWDIEWLRDGMFAAEALTRTGHPTEAEAALDFFLRGPFGAYQSYLGLPYGVSVCRYFGSGEEESDSNENGPNVELDGFGMILEEAALHVTTSGHQAWFDANRAHLDGLVADVLVGFRDPATHLVAAESSIWETHWNNGARQRWAFTSGRAVRGLDDWAAVIEARAGSSDPKVALYRGAAGELDLAMRTSLVDPTTGALAASVEQLARGSAFADVQTALVMRKSPGAGRPSIDAASPLGLATLDLLKNRLFLASTTARGYKRNDDGGWYDEQEWIVADLGLSRALRDAGRTAEADALLDWVTAEGKMNFGLLAELLDQTTAGYAGAIPMVGFGAGAYVLALIHRSGTRVPYPTSPDAGLPDLGPAPDASPLADGGLGADASASPDASAPQDAAADAGERGDAGAKAPVKQTEGCGCASVEAAAEARGAERGETSPESGPRRGPSGERRATSALSGLALAALALARGLRRRGR